MKIVLASTSPRRKRLLSRLIGEFETVAPSYEEKEADLSFEKLVEMHALEKARSVAKDHKDSIVIGGDVFVVFQGEIFEKPKDEEDAKRMLKLFSGNTVGVYTGQAVILNDKEIVQHIHAMMTFKNMSDDEIAGFIASGEPMDKAGAIGTDKLGTALLEGFNGDYFAIRGLSLVRLAEMLRELGYDVFKPRSR